jgi:Ca-activated chloride channel family protein
VPVLKVETHLIDMTVSVHDRQGGLVPGLTKDDLTVVEDGVPQTIRFFSRAEQLPLSIGLVVDESGSQEKFVKEHERDIEEFLKETLAPGDQAFAVCFGNHVRLVSDWTGSGTEITGALRRFDKDAGGFPVLGADVDRELGTALDDAVFYAATERMAGVKGRRKVLLVFSDGEENSSEHDLLDTIEAAQDADVLVYAIRYTELSHGRMNARDRYGVRELDHLTGQTGGRTYDAHAMKVREAFAEIAGDLRSLYGVAYQSTNRERDGRYRSVVIRPRDPELVMRARAGYYAR